MPLKLISVTLSPAQFSELEREIAVRKINRCLLVLSLCLVACTESESNQDILGETDSVSQAVTGTPFQITPYNLNTLQFGDYYAPYNVLRWTAVASGTTGGINLAATYKQGVNKTLPNGVTILTTTVADPGGSFWGECVSLAKSLVSPSHPLSSTANWQKGVNVLASGNVPVGTVIASFRNGSTYDQNGNDHTAIFGGYTGGPSIWVYDENWELDGLVRHHTINVTSGSGPGNAAAFYVVNSP